MMTDKTFSSTKSSSKSSSSSLALKAETTKSVIYVSLSLSLLPRVVDAKTKSTLTKAHKVSRFFYCVACEGRTTWTPQRKERTQRKQRDSRDFRTDSVARDTRKETTRAAKKATRKISLAFSLQSSPEFCLVRCVWEIRILFN